MDIILGIFVAGKVNDIFFKKVNGRDSIKILFRKILLSTIGGKTWQLEMPQG